MITKADILEAREQGIIDMYNRIYTENQTFIDFTLEKMMSEALKEGIAEAYIRSCGPLRGFPTVSYKVNGDIINCDYAALPEIKKWFEYHGYYMGGADNFGGVLITCN